MVRSKVRGALAAALFVAGLISAHNGAQAQSTTTTSVTSSLNPSQVLQSVTFTATVAGNGNGAPTNSVTFKDGTTSLGSGTLSAQGVGKSFEGGSAHTCAVTSAGGVKCWGDNTFGQLGNSGGESHVPVDVAGLTGIAAVAVGANHTCALTTGGGVKCWGLNFNGQLGNSTHTFTNTANPTPTDVAGLPSIAAISAGGTHTCALTTAGGIKCWGQGALGHPSIIFSTTPVDVSGLTSGAAAVTTGFAHSCAVTTGGAAKCWGENFFGQLGNAVNGATACLPTAPPNTHCADVKTPVGAARLDSGVSAIISNGTAFHTCALLTTGEMQCWGKGDDGQIGNGLSQIQDVPDGVSGLTSGVAGMSVGATNSCALMATGAVKCWGSNSDFQVGDDSDTSRNTPRDLALSGISLLAGGSNFNCALSTAGALSCWGLNLNGQLGDNSTTTRHTPTPVPSLGSGTVLVSGKATLATSSLTGGSHSITAVYGGDGTHLASTSPVLTQTVNKLNQTITFNSPAPTNPSVGATYTPSATATSGLTVSFGVIGACSFNGTLVTFIAAGSCTVTADQAGDADTYNAALQATQSISVAKTTPSVTLGVSPDPSIFGQSLTFTASVGNDGINTPTGTVTVNFGDSSTGDITLSGGTGTTNHTYAAAGNYTASGTYNGNSNYNSASSNSVSPTVNKANQTITGISAAPTDAKVGGTTYTPTGTASSGLAVTFSASGACNYSGGAVHFASAGICTVSADQAGNGNFNAAPTQTQPFSVAKGDTTTTLITSGSPTQFGQTVTFTATVAGGDSLTPPGTVTFKDGGSTIGTGTLSSGQATLQTSSLSIGNHTITASYDGNSNFNGSTSSNVSQQVGKASSAGLVRSFFSPSTFGDSVTLTTLVSGMSGGSPNGMVQFKDGADALGSAVAVNTLGAGYPIAAGVDYACALTAAGGVKCWGHNDQGQLGNTANTSANPTPLDTGLSGIVAIASGFSHSCALTAAGGVKCWGSNEYGELGSSANNGTSNPNPTPIDTGLSDIVAIAAGQLHTCAVTAAGGVKCWGNNFFGQLGTSTNSGTDNPNPTPLDTGLSGVVAIAAGPAHTCALTAAGGVKCWGWNVAGQLGSSTNAGTNDPNPTPIDVGLSNIVAIASGTSHNCALTAAGGLKCWGSNKYGQLGSNINNGTVSPNSTPIDVGVSGIVAVAAGFGHTCALTSAGGMQCWGYNTNGQLASNISTGTENANPTPLDTGLSGIAAIAAGTVHSCALTAAGAVKCWGSNYYGELGSTTNNLVLNPNPTPLDVTDFGAGAAQVYGNAKLSSSALTGGSHSITAVYSGDGNHDGSTSSALTQTVNKANQTISFNLPAPAGARFGGSYNPAATATSGLTVLFGASGACSYSAGIVSFNSAGTCIVTADQAGNSNYNAASQTTQVFAIGKADQTVSFSSSPPVGAKFSGTYNPAATATSGLAVAFGASGACSYSGGMVSFNSAGICTVTADQAGNSNYNAAPQAAQTFGIGKADQTVSFTTTPPASAKVGGTYIPAATATSSLVATFGASAACSFAAGTVTFNVAGPCMVTADQSGNANYNAAPQAAQFFSIGKATITASVISSGSPAVFGQSVTFTATVSGVNGTTPSGTVTFKDGAATLGSKTLSGTTATSSTSSLAVGAHSITAEYSGDSNFNASTSSVLPQTINKGATTLTLQSTTNPSQTGQAVMLTATAAATSPASGTPTGSITFKNGASTLGTAALSGGTATFSVSSLTTGTHSLTAVYDGDANFNAKTSSALSQTVNKGATTLTLQSTPNPSQAGQAVTLTATAAATSPASGTPTGSITFKNGASTLGTAALSGGIATFSVSSLTTGTHSLTAVYDGDGNFNAKTSSALSQTVNKGAMTLTLQATPNPSQTGQPVAFTATISITGQASGTPTGSITFKDGGTTLGSQTLSGTTAAFSTSSLTVGTHSITALYSGDENFGDTTSVATPVTVKKGETSLTLNASHSVAKVGRPVNLKATVAVMAPAAATPAGSILFMDGGRRIGSDRLASGAAQISTTALTVGTHTITAGFGGNTKLKASSATATVTVSAAVGNEARVNSTTAGAQQSPAVAVLKSGYVVVWASSGQDKSGYGIYLQRYSANGAKAGSETKVNTTTTGDQMQPSVTALKDGRFVVVWQSANNNISGPGIYGQMFKPGGTKTGVQFKVSAETTGNQSMPSVAPLASGGLVVTWTSTARGGSGPGVYAQLYDATATAVGSQFKVNETAAGDQSNSVAAGLIGGGFVVAWQGPDASGLGIYAKRYDAAGNALGNQFAVNNITLNDQSLPAIAALGTGGFVVAWQSGDASGLGVSAQRYSETGAQLGGEIRVNTTMVNDQGTPSVAAFTDGGYVVAWTSSEQDGSGQGIYAQAYTSEGARADVEFLVNTTTHGDQYQPAVAAFGEGEFVVVWTSANDGGGQGIYSQRFMLPGTN